MNNSRTRWTSIQLAYGLVYMAVGSLVCFGALAFFVEPHYEKGVALIFQGLGQLVTNILSFIFGVHHGSTAATAAPAANAVQTAPVPAQPVEGNQP